MASLHIVCHMRTYTIATTAGYELILGGAGQNWISQDRGNGNSRNEYGDQVAAAQLHGSPSAMQFHHAHHSMPQSPFDGPPGDDRGLDSMGPSGSNHHQMNSQGWPQTLHVYSQCACSPLCICAYDLCGGYILAVHSVVACISVVMCGSLQIYCIPLVRFCLDTLHDNTMQCIVDSTSYSSQPHAVPYVPLETFTKWIHADAHCFGRLAMAY